MTTAYLASDLKQDEGLRLTAYRDTTGVWTIGYGHAHVEPGVTWTLAEAEAALAADIEQAASLCDAHIPWWRGLSDERQDVLAEMAFNMGWLSEDGLHGLGTFRRTLAAIQAGEFETAARGLLDSAWAEEVGRRADRLAEQLRTGRRSSAC